MLCMAALGGLTSLWLRSTAAGAETNAGFLKVVSELDSAAVFIDGKASGTTPISLTLPVGVHRLRVQRGQSTQELSLSIENNASTVHHFSWSTEPVHPSAGSLRITTDGDPGTVTIDKQQRGSTPLTVNDLGVGDHDVVVVRRGVSYERTVRVDPGATASLVIGASASQGVSSGWLSATAAVPLRILEDGKLVGSTASERILMPAGKHTFQFDEPSLGFTASRTVEIIAGRTQSVAIELPQAPISINATPWAEVWLDGRSLGDTPIGNISTSVGAHEIVLRHPQLGERRVTALVTMKEPVRIGVDMRRPQ